MMDLDPLWTLVGPTSSGCDEASLHAQDCGTDESALTFRKSTPFSSVDQSSGLIVLGNFIGSSNGLSPPPSVHADSRHATHEQGDKDDSLQGVSGTTGFAFTTNRTTPTTLSSSASETPTSPAPDIDSLSTEAPLVEQVGYASTQGTRRSMEDRHIIEVRDGYSFFGVYDGHGGSQCAEYLQTTLHTLFSDHVEAGETPEAALTTSIIEADDAFVVSQSQSWSSEPAGSCCAVVVLTDTHLIVGNVGDSEVVRCCGGQAQVLSVRHTPRANAEELQRVQQAGGRVVGSRVRHPARGATVSSIALSRSIGDAGFKLPIYTDGKASGVIADPYVHAFERSDSDEFVVIGCDGLWDAVSHATVVKQCREMLASSALNPDGALVDATTIADALVNTALEEGSSDNITVIVILFPARRR